MNFLNRKVALKLTMIGVFLLLACQNENQYLDLIKLNSIVSDDLKNTSTKINYQGILINHRFETTVQDLEKVHTKNYLKEVYNKFRSEHYHTAASRSESEHIALPGPNALLEASKVVLVDFPYEKIENFNSLLLPEENYFNLDMVATTCGGPNEADAREMDYHNNFIGRDLWGQNSTYRTLLGIRVGLRKPSTSDLKEIARYRVDKRSCFIVKEHPDDVVFNYTVVETRQEILNMNATTIVYILERIAPKLQRTQVSYDFSDCGGGSDSGFNEFVDINHIDGNTIDLDDPCVRRIYTTTFVSACFISKDANYNPY